MIRGVGVLWGDIKYLNLFWVILCKVDRMNKNFSAFHSRLRHGRLARLLKWRACDVGEAKERLENEMWCRWSSRRVGKWAVTLVKRRKGLAMSCDGGDVTESLENEERFPSLHLRHSSFSKPSVALPMSQLILQSFRCFTYVTAHSPTLLSLLLRHRSFIYVTWRAAHGVTVKSSIDMVLNRTWLSDILSR